MIALLDYLLPLLQAPLFYLGKTPIALVDLLETIFGCWLVLFLSRFASRVFAHRFLLRFGLDEGNRVVIATLLGYSLNVIGFVILFQSQGVDLASFTLLAGGLGVGIGFGFQDITRNFISGLTLLLERNLKVGDFIEVEGVSGYIREISIRSTRIRTLDGGDVIVPNSLLVTKHLLNWSYQGGYEARIRVPVSVAYSTDPLLVTESLLKASYGVPMVLDEPAPQVLFTGFGENALEFALQVWINRIDLLPNIKSALNFHIEYHFRSQGIKIPFPQRELWVHQETQEASTSAPANEELIHRRLKEISLFANFNELELRELMECGKPIRLTKEEVLFVEDTPGNAFYIILEGILEVYSDRLGTHLADLGRGKFVGELAVMLGIPRTASVRALTAATLFMINSRGFHQLLEDCPDLYDTVVETLEQRREELYQRQRELEELGLLSDLSDEKSFSHWIRKRLQQLFPSSTA